MAAGCMAALPSRAADSPPRPPDLAQRQAATVRPAGPPVMYQRWQDLLFLHWEHPAAAIQATLPEGLWVDTFEGRAFLGVVPFAMRDLRPRLLPAVPGLSNFLELNLRTYVTDRSGVPGVWFYSLDADQRLAVEIARRFFHLPYEHARISGERLAGGALRFVSARRQAGGEAPACSLAWTPGAELPRAEVGSLEFFLVERYRLYSRFPDGLRRGAVWHEPYRLRRAWVTEWSEALCAPAGFIPTGRPPDHAVMAPGVEVSIFPLERV